MNLRNTILRHSQLFNTRSSIFAWRLLIILSSLSLAGVITSCGSDDDDVVLLTPAAEGVEILNPYEVTVQLNKPAPKNLSVMVTNPLPNLMTISPLEFDILEGESTAKILLKQIETIDSNERERGTLKITLETDPPSMKEWDFVLVGPAS